MKTQWIVISLKLHLITFYMLIKVCDQTSLCPSVCHEIACQTGVLSCTEGGLVQIPLLLPVQTTKIILSNQVFLSSHLEYSNISHYSFPKFKIVKLTIQNCGITSIASNIFSYLTELSVLDLSNNYLESIVPDTFSSLNLKFLRLDGNRNVVLNKYSFRGLSVTELSLIDCQLTELNYEVISQISGSLKKLILTKNRLKTLEKSFKNLFEHLHNIQINDNPFNCTCNLKWLSSFLLGRKNRQESLQESPVLFNETRCNSPIGVKNQRIIDLSSKDFNCDLPKISIIDVYMISNMSAKLTCIAEKESHFKSDVIWITERNNKYIHEVQSKENAALIVSQQSKIGQFQCVIVNDNGNVSMWVTIQWPLSYISNLNKSSFNLNETSNNVDSSLFVVNNTINIHSLFFYVKRFTLLEMIGGVLGTFTISMILFICIYRHIVISMKNNDKKKWYISYTADVRSDSQTYDIPINNNVPYYPGHLITTNHYNPAQYYNSHSSNSTPNKFAAL